MYVRIRSQYFTDERGEDSTLVVASENIGRENLNTLGECVALVTFAANSFDEHTLELFRDALRSLVLSVVPTPSPRTPPTPACPPVREVGDDPRFSDEEGDVL